ncbi:hypothetical protein [Rhizobium sp. S96]|uniref:hypothetical protein n=1 Tax=Rhizobium sp. S96 TaxID=3055140 RepID=UPI0025AB420D|nr:hypothetical protein [Rhizobium sp. S96]MDM9619095.1 hypothetical protein [Rhizobium sp. S96]
MLPIVEILADAQSHAARADWLFACPQNLVYREHMTIRRLLQKAGLLAGVGYLDALLARGDARRLPDGRYPQTIELTVELAAQDLRAAVRAGTEGAE